jgi:hypothetical protein
MPQALRRVIHQLVSEAVLNRQEVLRYVESDQADGLARMTLYRARVPRCGRSRNSPRAVVT